MTHYQAGRRFEWEIRADLQKKGYTVARTAGSKSPVDLIAWNDTEIIFVQCKYGAKPTLPKNPPVPIGELKASYALLWKPRGKGIDDVEVLKAFTDDD